MQPSDFDEFSRIRNSILASPAWLIWSLAIMYQRQIDGTTYTHEFLWRAGAYSLAHAKDVPAGSHYFLTNSFIVSFLAFEAFVNFLGEIVDREAWSDERRFFSREPYRGIVGKVCRLAEVLKVPISDTDLLFVSFLRAKGLRDKIAHGKVARSSSSFLTDDRDSRQGLDFMQLAWDELLDCSKIESVRCDLQELAERFRSSAKTNDDHVEQERHLLFPAFKGSLASASGSFRLIKDDRG